MYVMIGLSVLIFTGSLLKDKLFPSAPAPEAPGGPGGPEALEAPEAPEAPAPVDLALAKKYADIKADFNKLPAGDGNSAAALKIAGLPLGNPVKKVFNNLPDGTTNYTPVKAALNTEMKANPLPPGFGQRVLGILRK
jgi:hypothetical protein